MKKEHSLRLLTTAGIFAALITFFTAFFVHIPVGANGGYIHFGDALIYIAACLLPTPYAIAAAAIGGGLADLLTAPMWTIATIIIKSLLVLSFTSRNEKILCRRNIIAPWIAFIISAFGYYIAEAILFGGWAALIASITGSLVQSGGSAIFFYILAYALDKAKIKSLTPSWENGTKKERS